MSPGQGPAPGTPKWSKWCTASKVPAILGLSPWDSPWTMWHVMKGLISSDDGRNLAGKARGHYLEDGVIDWWLDQHEGATGERQKWHSVDDWAGATSDMVGVDEQGRRFVLNAKTASGEDGWWTRDEDGKSFMYPPAYYVASLLWEMWCADAEVGYVPVLFGQGGLKFREFEIARDDELIGGIVARCREFMDSLALDVPPSLDDTPTTYEAIRRLHPEIDPDLAVELDPAVAVEFVAAVEAFDAADVRRRGAHVAVLDAMGRAKLAKCWGAVIARRQPNKYGVSFVPVARSSDRLPF